MHVTCWQVQFMHLSSTEHNVHVLKTIDTAPRNMALGQLVHITCRVQCTHHFMGTKHNALWFMCHGTIHHIPKKPSIMHMIRSKFRSKTSKLQLISVYNPICIIITQNWRIQSFIQHAELEFYHKRGANLHKYPTNSVFQHTIVYTISSTKNMSTTRKGIQIGISMSPKKKEFVNRILVNNLKICIIY